MGRSRESYRRKRSSGSKDSGHYAKRHANGTNYCTDLSMDDSSQSTNSSSLSTFYNMITYSQVPYHSWLIYFYNQEYNEKSSTVLKINAFMEFFLKNPVTSYDMEIGLNLDTNICLNDSTLLLKWPNVMDDLKMNPQHTLNCINAAFFEVMMQKAIKNDHGNVERVFRILRLNRTNILNYEKISLPTSLKLSSHGKLIYLTGNVVAVGCTKVSSDFLVFFCKCKRQILSRLRIKEISITKKCEVCGNGRFKRLLDSPYKSTKVSQNIYIKDYRTTEQVIEDGEAISPSIISINLSKSLVDKFIIGDKLRIIGIPRVKLGASKSLRSSGSNPLYVDAQSVYKENDSCENFNTGINQTLIIEKMKEEPDILSLLVHSLCPNVQGHEILKAALVLGLFAGTPKNNEIRNYINILIIGNLGIGKSQLLRACAKIATKGTYIRGSSTISLGCTMTVDRENSMEDYRLEAGALALADSGWLCLDELDKMSNQHQILYNAMLREKVEMMNSELKICLPSRTSVFAVTNSTRKRYDPSKTVLENLNMNRQLLGRFDLIFLMRDNPDKYFDKIMCDRILDEHTKRNRLIQENDFSGWNTIDEPENNVDRTLRERLMTPNNYQSMNLLPETIFKMYINYARFFVKPIFSNPSKIVIQRYCLIRLQKDKNLKGIERLVQTLVTLTEARAKVDLRTETSVKDVFDAIEIMEHSMSIDTKDFSQPRSSNDKNNKLTANKVKQFLDNIGKEVLEKNKKIFTTEELRNIAGQENMTENTLSALISKLNDQGYLLKISSNSYKIVFHQGI